MPTIAMVDGAEIYYKDWGGSGQPVVFSHGWPLTADAFEDQMMFLAGQGYRCIAHDRRGHGRSSQPSTGNDMDTYADALAALVQSTEFAPASGQTARSSTGTSRSRSTAPISTAPKCPRDFGTRSGSRV